MADIALADLNARYGPINVFCWCDLDNAGDRTASPLVYSSDMTARVNAAIAYAAAVFYGAMLASPYSRRILDNSNVLHDDSGSVPLLVADSQVKLAGYWLSTARGVKDYDKEGNPMSRLYADYLDAQNTIKAIQNQAIKLPNVSI